MLHRNYDRTRLLDKDTEEESSYNSYDHHHHHHDHASNVSPTTVRQNIAAETSVNLNFSLKYNIISLILSVSKIVATTAVMLTVPKLCYSIRQIWLFFLLFYDILHTRVIIMTIQNIFDMNNVIAAHEPVLNYNLHRRGNNKQPQKSNTELESVAETDFDHDELREYDVEIAHKTLRISSLSPRASRRRKRITQLLQIDDIIYFILFVSGQCLYFLSKGNECEAPQTNQLMLVYLVLGWIWLFTPMILFFAGCLCLPFVLFVIYFFIKGNRIPKARIDVRKLNIKEYHEKMEGNGECHICVLNYHEGDRVVQLECDPAHHFHEACLKRWLKLDEQCPVCKENIELPKENPFNKKQSKNNHTSIQIDEESS